MAIIPYISHRDWLSDTLLRYGVISEPLPKVISNEDIFHDGDTEEDDDKYLKSLDPTKWKEQDHYAILGLKKQRFSATEEDIRRNYRKKILIHHPDKREGVDRDNDYFACITKAFEILGDPVKRRSYDSVDPTFDEDVPTVGKESKKNFYKVFRPVFERNARWSEIHPVPGLGNSESSRDEVDLFYRFWFDFKSWREYSYQDEEDKEKGSDREERRWIEKENRAVRESKKKEEVSRIRKLVDNAYACDPRIVKFKEEEKMERVRGKEARERERKERMEEQERKVEEERQAAERKRQEEERKLKAQREAERKEKEMIKRKRKAAKKQVQEVFTQEYFPLLDGKEKINAMTKLELLLQDLSLEELQKLHTEVESCTDVESRRNWMESKLESSSNPYLANQGKKVDSLDQNSNVSSKKDSNVSSKKDSTVSSKKWSTDECLVLTKAAKLFPPGTQKRWEVITSYFNQHSGSGIKRKERDVQEKYHELKNPAMARTVSKEASHSGSANVLTANGAAVNGAIVDAAAIPSERYEPLAEESTTRTWTTEEQVIFEQALRTYPKTLPKQERWTQVASCLPGRSVKDCLERFKQLSSMVRDKREAQQSVTNHKK